MAGRVHGWQVTDVPRRGGFPRKRRRQAGVQELAGYAAVLLACVPYGMTTTASVIARALEHWGPRPRGRLTAEARACLEEDWTEAQYSMRPHWPQVEALGAERQRRFVSSAQAAAIIQTVGRRMREGLTSVPPFFARGNVPEDGRLARIWEYRITEPSP